MNELDIYKPKIQEETMDPKTAAYEEAKTGVMEKFGNSKWVKYLTSLVATGIVYAYGMIKPEDSNASLIMHSSAIFEGGVYKSAWSLYLDNERHTKLIELTIPYEGNDYTFVLSNFKPAAYFDKENNTISFSSIFDKEHPSLVEKYIDPYSSGDPYFILAATPATDPKSYYFGPGNAILRVQRDDGSIDEINLEITTLRTKGHETSLPASGFLIIPPFVYYLIKKRGD